MTRSINNLILICIALLTISKSSLIGYGFLAFPDESRYGEVVKGVTNFLHGDIVAGLRNLFSIQGRPGEGFIKLIPAAIQLLSSGLSGLYIYDSFNSYPIFIFNFFTHALILLVHYKFCKLVFKDHFIALLCVLIYSVFTNSYLYIRHALPYDQSLLILYFILYLTYKNLEMGSMSSKKAFYLGVIAFLGFLVYPGYFALFATPFFLIVYNDISKNRNLKFSKSSFFALGCICCLVVTESLSHIAGKSYIWQAGGLSLTITQGSFSECFAFLIKYLFEVEKLPGLIMLTGLILSFYWLSKELSKPIDTYPNIFVLFVIIFGSFIAYASAGYFLHLVVFYGRLLHQYFPFLCIFSIYGFYNLVLRIHVKKEMLLLIAIPSIIYFIMNFIEYKSYAYPLDEEYRLSKQFDLQNALYLNENQDAMQISPDYHNISKGSRKPSKDDKAMILVNFDYYFFPLQDISHYKPLKTDSRYKLILNKPYFLNFKAYQYEGFNVTARNNISSMDLHIKAFIGD